VTAGGSGVFVSRSVVAFTMKCANWLGSLGLFGRAEVFVVAGLTGLPLAFRFIPQVWHGVLKRLKRKVFQSSPLPTPCLSCDTGLQCAFDGKPSKVAGAVLVAGLGKRGCFPCPQFGKTLKIPSRLPI